MFSVREKLYLRYLLLKRILVKQTEEGSNTLHTPIKHRYEILSLLKNLKKQIGDVMLQHMPAG